MHSSGGRRLCRCSGCGSLSTSVVGVDQSVVGVEDEEIHCLVHLYLSERRLLLIFPRAADGPLTASMMAGVLVRMTYSKILMSPCLFLSEENSVFPALSVLSVSDSDQGRLLIG